MPVSSSRTPALINRLLPMLLTALAACALPLTASADQWVEGTNYTVIDPAVQVSTPGKIEVVEVFSYACPHCKDFVPFADKIRAALPAEAEFVKMPASFGFDAWSTFARAFYAAKALGVADKAHHALFKAVFDTQSISPIKPTLADLAAFYSSYGVNKADFLATADSFGVKAQLKRTDERIKAYGVTGTPSLIVNGKYRLDVASAGGFAQTVELVDWLVAREKAASDTSD